MQQNIKVKPWKVVFMIVSIFIGLGAAGLYGLLAFPIVLLIAFLIMKFFEDLGKVLRGERLYGNKNKDLQTRQ